MTTPHDFPFDEYDQDFYTSGDCYNLAWHLNQEFGLPMYVVASRDDWSIWSHMLAKWDNDLYLDADGFLNASGVIENHGDRFGYGLNAQLIPIDQDEYDLLTLGQSPSIIDSKEHRTNARSLYAWAEHSLTVA